MTPATWSPPGEQGLKAKLAEQRLQEQVRLAGVLVKLRDHLAAHSGSDELRASLARLIDELTPFESEPTETALPPPSDGDRHPPVALN